MSRLEQTLNKPLAVLVATIVAVVLNVLLYFVLPGMTPLIAPHTKAIGTSLPEPPTTLQQQSEAANISSAGDCTGSGGAVLQQEGRGEVSNGKIAFQRFPLSGPPPYEELYVIDENGTNETRLSDNPAGDEFPHWSPDGQKIAFESLRDGPTDIYLMDADGTNETRLADSSAMRRAPAWSPDGEKIAFLRSPTESSGNAADVYVIDEDGTNERRLTQTGSDPEARTSLGGPVWSPDGEKIAFSSSAITVTPPSSDSPESAGASTAPAEGMTGIYVIDMATADLCKLTSTGTSPTWSPDGDKIAFYDNDAINVINPDGSERRELIDAVSAQPAQAWSPDGERIAFVRQAELYVINADGSGQRLLANATETVDLPAWSPDGEKIAFPCPAAPGAVGTDLCVMNADGTEWKRVALKVGPEEVPPAASWGKG